MKNNRDEFELTKGQKLAGNMIAGAYTVACGVFLLVVGLGSIEGLTVSNTALPTILLTVGLVFLTTAIIQTNTVSLWLSFAFIVPAVVSYLNNFTPLGYAQLYPLYIAIPAIASLFTMLMSRSYRDHLKAVLFFGVIAGIFAIESSGAAGWGVVVPVLVVFVGLMIVFTALKLNKSEDDNE
jgi:membrane protein